MNPSTQHQKAQQQSTSTQRPKPAIKVTGTQEAIAKFLVNKESVRIDLPMGRDEDNNNVVMRHVVSEIKHFQRMQNPRVTVRIELNQNTIFMTLVLLTLTFSVSMVTWLMVSQFNSQNQSVKVNTIEANQQ